LRFARRLLKARNIYDNSLPPSPDDLSADRVFRHSNAMNSSPRPLCVLTRTLCLLPALLVSNAGFGAALDYPDTVLSDHPVAYYRLEELPGAATAADSSGSGFDATYVMNSAGTYPQLGLPGIDTNSVLFNGGTSDFGSVQIPYNILLSPTNSDGITGAPFSAECWVQATTDSPSDYTAPLAMSGPYTASYPNASGWNFYQSQGPGSSWALFIRGGSVYTFTGPKVTLLKWYHLAVTWDGTNAVFYVNGASQGSSAIAYKAVDPAVGYAGSIGSGPQTGHGAFAGGVDEVAFYTNALGADRIAAHYELGTNSFRAPPTPPSFVSFPASTTNYSGTIVKLSATVGGTAPISYQWKKNGVAIAGATSSEYSFVCAYPADNNAGFILNATNSVGATNSPVATLTVLTNLNIINDPYGPITRNVGSKAAFRVVANGALPIAYQWFKGTTALNGQTNDTLWLNNVQNSDAANYHAHVAGPFGAADTAEAALMMQPRAITVPLTNYARIVAVDDPVAYFRLNEAPGSATAVDAVGSFDAAFDSSLGGISFNITPGIPHETDPAVDLSDTNETAIGKGGVVRIPYALELNPYGPWSVEAWVRPDSNDTKGNFRTVLSSLYNFNFSTAVYGWAIYQHPNGGNGAWTLALFNGSGGPSFFGSDFGHIPLIPMAWYHLVLTDNGSTIQLYVNGVAGSANAPATGFLPNGINGDPALSASPAVLGQRSDGAYNGFSGGVDEVAFYNYALSSSQIATHFANAPRLSVGQNGAGVSHNSIVLTWSVGTLESATGATGPYLPVTNAASPYTNNVGNGAKFFRLKLP